jgi:hypothetical protein
MFYTNLSYNISTITLYTFTAAFNNCKNVNTFIKNKFKKTFKNKSKYFFNTFFPGLKYREIKAQINDFPPAHILNIASFRF